MMQNRHFTGKTTAYQRPGKDLTVHQIFVDQVKLWSAKEDLRRKKRPTKKKVGACAQCQAARQRSVAAG